MMKQNIGMYENTATWNPFIGCQFGCIYCGPSFKRQMKRRKQDCLDCYGYKPHYHPERLKAIPKRRKDIIVKKIFVCGYSDISFCDPGFTRRIISRIREENTKRPGMVYYFQSKRPEYFSQFLGEYPENVILLTTLETNRDEGYKKISNAPRPLERYERFLSLDYPRKVLTIEPVMDFDTCFFVDMVTCVNPEHVYLGYNSKPRVQLPEPSMDKFHGFCHALKGAGIEVRIKKVRGQ